MRVFAYCAQAFRDSVSKAAGVAPVTSPPLTAESFPPALLMGYDLLMFDLHGRYGRSVWYGQPDGPIPGRVTALTDRQVRSVNLGGAVVFASSCHMDRDASMLAALLDAGASCVIGGDGINYGGRQSPTGAGLLGLWVRRWLGLGLSPGMALRLAKARLVIDVIRFRLAGDGPNWLAAKDALGFRVYRSVI